eukprot:4367156-Prymnesium_polylepis.3
MGPRHSIQREIMNRWHGRKSRDVALGSRCIETGDGHFVRAMRRCAVRWSADLINLTRGSYRLDLEAPPSAAPPELRAAHGSFDVAVSHQVFEHLARPSTGITNINALLRVRREKHTRRSPLPQKHALASSPQPLSLAISADDTRRWAARSSSRLHFCSSTSRRPEVSWSLERTRTRRSAALNA